MQTFKDHDYRRTTFYERNERLVSRLSREKLLGGRVLDFGAGTGHLALHIAPRVKDVWCVEADENSRRSLSTTGMLKVSSTLDEVEGLFDLVLLIEVIEHIDDPVFLLTKLRQKLSPNGKLFLTTPCGQTRSGSTKTNAYDTQEHIHFFTEQSLDIALRKAGFGTFQFRVMKEMYPRAHGIKRIASLALDVVRPVRSALFGHRHLVGWVTF